MIVIIHPGDEFFCAINFSRSNSDDKEILSFLDLKFICNVSIDIRILFVYIKFIATLKLLLVLLNMFTRAPKNNGQMF